MADNFFISITNKQKILHSRKFALVKKSKNKLKFAKISQYTRKLLRIRYYIKLIFSDMASFIMYFYFLYYDDSHSERQSFINVSLLKTIKKSTYITQLTFLVLFSQLCILYAEAAFEKCSLKLEVHKIRQNPWHTEER